jgi:hypothetical protein
LLPLPLVLLSWNGLLAPELHVQWITPLCVFHVLLYKGSFTTWAFWLMVLSFLLLLGIKWHSRLTHKPFTRNIHISQVAYNMLWSWMMEHRVLINMKGLWSVEYIPPTTTCMWSDNSIQSLQWTLMHFLFFFTLSTNRISSTLVKL